jgi:hypothetical protein
MRRASVYLIWHRPTFEGPCGPTIIGAGGLNCRVRDGNGWDPTAMGARNFIGIPHRDGEPELEPIAWGNLAKLYREELPVSRRHER